VFHKYMNERMNKWDGEMASEGELKIAGKMNKIANYT
jgi:hypothetical protein